MAWLSIRKRHIIQDEGSDQPARIGLNFTGAGKNVSTIAGAQVIDIPGGGGVSVPVLTRRVDNVNGAEFPTNKIFDLLSSAFVTLISNLGPGFYEKVILDSGTDSTNADVLNGIFIQGAANYASVVTGTITFNGAAIGANLADIPAITGITIGSGGIVTIDGAVASSAKIRECIFLFATFNINAGAGNVLIEDNNFILSTLNILALPASFRDCLINVCTINSGASGTQITTSVVSGTAVTGSETITFTGCQFIFQLTTANGVTARLAFRNSILDSCTFSGQHDVDIIGGKFSITLAATYTGTVTIESNAVGTITDNSGGGATIVTRVVTGNQSAITVPAANTTVGANTGTSGAGLSLIGDTSTTDQSANVMNDLVALQEDVAENNTKIDAILVAMRTGNLIQT